MPRLSLITLLALAACSQGEVVRVDAEPVEFDANTGGDADHTQAPILAGLTHSDDLDAEAGDNTDIVGVDIDEDSDVDVLVRIDEPCISGELALLDGFGAMVEHEQIFPGDSRVEIENVDLRRGRFYVRIVATACATSYNYEIDAAPHVSTQGALDPFDEGNPNYVPPDVSDDDDDGGSTTRVRRDDDDDDDGGAVVEADEDDGGTGRRATIVNLRLRDEGVMLIMRGCGSSSELEVGDRGRVSGTTYRATITRITGRDTCEAESEGTMEELAGSSRVRF